MKHEFKTKDVCSKKISFMLDGSIVRGIQFTGGCDGNLKAISILAEGMTVGDIIAKLSGNTCGKNKTSCADQFASAVKTAYETENKEK